MTADMAAHYGIVNMNSSALQAIDMLRADGAPVEGLVPVRRGQELTVELPIDERAVITDAASFDDEHCHRIDYVFFRRFSDGRSSHVAAYVVDNSNHRLTEQDLAKLHLQIWLQGRAPLLYVAWPSRVDVLACARGDDFWDKRSNQERYSPAKRLEIDMLATAGAIAGELQMFSAFRLADGTFWEDPANSHLVDHTKAAHQCLIESIVQADRDLDGERNPSLRRLLLLMVLIKYLEDRDVFPSPSWFGRWRQGARGFFDILRGGAPDEVYAILDFLERKFNGDVFALPYEGSRKLTRQNLHVFADFIEARTRGRQMYLWKLYSFEHIPVEVISHLYQRFVRDGRGAVYTPPFLASLLLDQVMPYSQLSGDERILDPACGSGVFLVGAFRRLVNLWRSRNNWRKPDVRSLKKILKKSIFGIEMNSFAVDLTAFSLSLAICDALKPDVIWNELQFDRLRDANLTEADFFGEVMKAQNGAMTVLAEKFDIIVGNPPFESKLSDAGRQLNEREADAFPERGRLSDKQVAYLFLEQACKCLGPDGKICLIQPSGFLYNRNPQTFRTAFFKGHLVETILDFTSIRNLYQAADPKTIAVLARSTESESEHSVNHWTFRRTTSAHERVCFELDHYDYHRVPQDVAYSDPHVWRINLLGGGRLHQISERLRKMPELREFVREKGWDSSEGFTVGNKSKRAPFLTGRCHLPAKTLKSDGFDTTKITILHETHFECPRRERIYCSPLIMIRELESLPMAFLDSDFLSYTHEIVGIKAPPPDGPALRNLYRFMRHNRRLLQSMVMLHGSRSFIGRSSQILKQDIDSLHIPRDLSPIDLSYWEEILVDDVVKYISSYVKVGQNSQILKRKATVEDLDSYSTLFVHLLASVYDNLHATEPYFLDGLTCQSFFFGDGHNFSPFSSKAHYNLRRLVYDEKLHAALRTIRIVRIYKDNVLTIIKPDRLRYWIRSTAIRDADETLIDLRRQGY